jgi:hypothetical protein
MTHHTPSQDSPRYQRPEWDIDLLITAPEAWLERRHWRSHVIGRPYREGRLLDGAL